MSDLKTDFNVYPYYDDYTEDKTFYRILFRPATAVQARELTQLQTILQKQISRFGDHVFKDGSIVDAIPITYHDKLPFVRVEDSFNTNTLLSVLDFDNTFLLTNGTNSNNAIRAKIKISKNGFKSNYPATNRFYVDYIKTGKDGSNNDVTEFASGDTIYIYSANQANFATLNANNLIDSVTVLAANATANSTGYGYGISAGDGVIYQKGFFSKVQPHTIIVKDFDQSPNGYIVGFQTNESIVNEAQDSTLNDNAAGFSNYNAPGAHRLKLTPTLVAKLKSDSVSNTDFFAIVEFDGDKPAEQHDDPVYNKLGEEFARRTVEESGDYVVKPFQVETIATEDSNTFYYAVSPGVAYVTGTRVELIGSKKIETNRATTTEIAQNQVITANYGNYVFCKELVGAMDFDRVGEVALYDAAQSAITDIEGVTAAPSGSIVGYANIRSVNYYSGTRGTPTAQYYVYLSNIRMNSGKSFSNDVKSVYRTGGTYGSFKADIVLESSKAILKDSSRNQLLFHTGVAAVRRLTNGVGVNDTSYVYRQTSSATIASNGQVTFTLVTPAPGGVERVNYSNTTLTDTAEYDFNMFFSANAYTANLTGTVTVTSGNTTVLGSGTTFPTQFVVGDVIRVGAAGAALYSIASISSNTSMTIVQTPGASYSANVFQKFFVGGSSFNLASTNGSITVVSNSQFTVNLNQSLGSGSQTVYAQYPVLRTTAVAASKEVNKGAWVKIDCSNNVGGTSGPWDLGLIDVTSINNIYVGSTYANTNPDRLDWFTLDNGQRDDFYDHARIFINPAYSDRITSSSKLLISLNHFTANTSAGIGFYSVESYPLANVANSSTITWAEIPRYKSPTLGVVDLRNVVDYRPSKYNTANTSSNASLATVNPAVSNSTFNVPASGQYTAEVDSNMIADIEYYLPRMDLLTINNLGDLAVRQGQPATQPKTPFNESDASVVAACYVPAFPSLTVREGETYGRKDIATKIEIRTNRRYTMKDIGALEERIKRLEYYTVLNALEQQARDLTIPDATGLNRFKNGIFADPFNSHGIGNVTDFEYKISVDKDNSVGRPYFKSHPADFKYSNVFSSGVQKTGSYVSLPYTNEKFVSQPFATKYRNCTESVWQFNGKLNLYPPNDYFRDESQAPNVNVNLDFSAPWEKFANSPFGTTFGDWRTTSSSVQGTGRTLDPSNFSSLQLQNATNFGGSGNATRWEETIITNTQQRIVSTMKVDTQTHNYDLGSYVKDFSIQPYMRSRLVAFVANNLKPNTRVYPFFDDTNVSVHCAPGILSGSTTFEEGKQDQIVTRNGNFGDTLVTDSTGSVYGVFKIPAGTFRVGDRSFQLTNVDNLVTGASAKITVASGTYSASSISVTKGSSSISTREPKILVSDTTQEQVVLETGAGFRRFQQQSDPISQSFFITSPELTSGVFITQVGVYFNSKDPNLGITCYVLEMRNGFPDITNIVAQGYLKSSDVSVSGDGSVETKFTFEQPCYLTSEKQYAFVIQPDGDSPEYTIWMGETGGVDVRTGEQVYSNPYAGMCFVSANRQTWTPIQKEDIKFNVYRAIFTVGSGTATFYNEDDEYLTVDGFTRANSSLAVEIGDVVYTINATSNTAITSNGSPFGIIQYIDEGAGKLYLDSSIGGFSNTTNPKVGVYRVAQVGNTSLINSNTLLATANITSVDDLTYHMVVPKFATIEPSRTTIRMGFKGTDSSNTIDSAFTSVTNNVELENIDKNRYLKSVSNEVTYMAGNKSSQFQVTLQTDSPYVSPVIDLSRKSSLFVENIINSNTTNEHTRYGGAASKYISKNVVLADGQEAEDLRVYMTAYRPVDTDLKVYIKFYNQEDPESFDTKVWSELSYRNDSDAVYSSSLDTSNFIEYELGLPAANTVAQGAFANSSTGIVEYTNSAGSRFVGYKTFAVKVVLLSNNAVRVPRINDVRAIALQI